MKPAQTRPNFRSKQLCNAQFVSNSATEPGSAKMPPNVEYVQKTIKQLCTNAICAMQTKHARTHQQNAQIIMKTMKQRVEIVK